MKNRKTYFKVYTQIIILVVAIFAFSYLVHEGSNQASIIKEEKINKASNAALLLLKVINKLIWNEKNIVSALGEDLLQTCMQTKDGRDCVEYLSDECAANCEEDCVPTRAADIAECKIGTCYDNIGGTCATGTPKTTCESDGGSWFDDPNGNVQECQKGCCTRGSETYFGTEGECSRISELSGINTIFRPEINTEADCLLESILEEEGACLFGKEQITEKYDCKFLTKNSCNSLNGDFHSGVLCSNIDLNTKCEKQKTTNCVSGKSEIYWFDSCGNRENIYDANKGASWNNGMVLSQGSCVLTNSNKVTCGNCNYLAGSTCGAKTSTEKLDDSTQDVVCKDLRCDENGDGIKERSHGESWCAYQGAIGVEGKRSVDTPGSRHFKKVCLYGEVRTEPCQDYRSEVCVENKAQSGGKSFSTAACRINSYMQCLNYDTEDCADNPDCFVKNVNLGEYFQFSMCAPKYPPGFDLQRNSDAAEIICSQGSQDCTAVFVKKLKGVRKVWKCEANCHCLKPEFTRQMNDLCMSLGDCGASVNYEGTLTTKGAVYGGHAFGFWGGYLNGLKAYENPIPGKTIDAGDATQIINSLWIPTNVGYPEEFNTTLDDLRWIKGTAKVSGMLGLLYFGLSGKIPYIGIKAFSLMKTCSVCKSITGPSNLGKAAPYIGAAAGFAATNYLIKKFGVGPGLPRLLIWTLLAAGTYAGYTIGQSLISTTASTGPVGWIILLIVVILLYIAKISGIGKIKERTVTFECNPWQPPRGGVSCEKCGDDGFPCSRYACQSLGSSCKFINEGTGEEGCIATNINDVAPPMISPGTISAGYQFATPSETGVQLRSTEGDGCIGAYGSVKFGIALDKPGRCRYSSLPFDTPAINVGEDSELSDEEFANFASGDINHFSSGLIKKEHSTITVIPSAESLGMQAYDPNKRTDYNLYIRCENANGYESNRDYVINMCAKPGQDLTPPLITVAEPRSNFVKYDGVEQNLKIFTNEPASCSWSTSDKAYELMEMEMDCKNGLGEQTTWGWACNSTLPITGNVGDENKFYIRCADKPWESDIANMNKNTESKSLNLTKTPELKIIYAEPNNETLVFGTSVGSINLEVRTSGGLSSGPICTASVDGENYYILLSTTNGMIHKVTLNAIDSGDKKIWLRCGDDVENIALEEITFKVEIDIDAPKITGIYYTGSLIVKTNEPATCTLSLERCEFNFANGTLMSGSELTHSASIEKNKIYYVKCKDKLGNFAGTCDAQFKLVR